MSRRVAGPTLAACLALAAPATLAAQERPSTPRASACAATEQVAAELLLRGDVRGGNVAVSLLLTMAPGWYIYAPDPGEAGLPTRLVWELPYGLTADPLRWPDPEVRRSGDVTVRVYERTLAVEGALRAAGAPGPGPRRAAATVSWAVCRDICLPQRVRLEVALPGTDGTAGSRTCGRADGQERSAGAGARWRR